jgi:hypothetical protein
MRRDDDMPEKEEKVETNDVRPMFQPMPTGMAVKNIFAWTWSFIKVLFVLWLLVCAGIIVLMGIGWIYNYFA